MSNTIESLEIEIIGSSQSAEKALDALEGSLDRLKNAVKGGCGLTAVTKQLTAMGTALGSMDSSSISNLNALAKGLETLSGISNLKLSSSIANQITGIGIATKSLNGVDFSKLTALANAISPLSTIGKANLGTTISQLGKLPGAVQPLVTMDMTGLSQKIRELVEAVKPLSEMGKANLGSTLNQIKKLPEAFATLNGIDMAGFAAKVKELATALRPLGDEMQKVANGFSAFPAKIQKLLNATNQIPKANTKAGVSYVNFAAKISMAYVTVRRISSVIASWINKSNEYIENLNLFTVAMGGYAGEAQQYAETVGELMGVDPSEWMRNQGVFMTLATGFGVANDRAYVLSQNLTQLGYDLSSFFNITYEDAMQKLQSGISGELEPLRRLGYDLSNAKLEAVALSLGIDKAVSSMTQAEKAELRYYAIMTQVTTAQGDMARTLDAPANQIRVFRSQVTQTARALGNIFIPALNAVLPYAIAVTKVIRVLANTVASLFGFSMPEVDYSGVNELTSGAADASDALDDATDSMKELNKAMMGIDELNVISADSGASGSKNTGDGSGFDFELPTYDFIDGATESRVGQIVEDMKEWLGITGEIGSWSDLFNTRLGQILILVGSIGARFALWKLSKGFLGGISAVKALLASPTHTITLGLTLALTGFAIEFLGISDAIKKGLDGFNFGEIILGGLLGTGGSALLGKGIGAFITKAFADGAVSKALTTAATNLFGAKAVEAMGAGAVSAVGASLSAGVGAIIAGIPAFIVGIYDALSSELDWMNAALTAGGATAAGAGIGVIIGALGGPIGAGIGALIGLAVGLITDGIILLVQNWESVSVWFQGVFTTVGQFFSDLWQSICDIWNVCAEWFDTNIIQPVSVFFSDLWTGISTWASEAWEDIKEAFGEIVSWFDTNIIQPVSEFFTGLWDDISSLASGCWQAIVEFFSPAIEWFSELFGSIWQTISDVFYNIGVIVSGCWEIIKAAWGIVCEWFDTNIIQPVSVFFSDLWTGISTWASEAWEDIKEAFGEIVSWFDTNIIQPVSVFFSDLWTGISTWASEAWEDIKEAFGEIVSWFDTNIIQPVSVFFSDLWTGISTWASEAWEDIKEAFGEIVSWFDTNIIQPVSVFFSDLWDGFSKAASEAWDAVCKVFSDVTGFFEDVFSDAWEAVVNVFSIAGDIFVDIKDGILSAFKTIVNAIIDGINSVVAVPFGGINWALGKIKDINILGLRPFSDLKTISVPTIPHLAEGGVVSTGQMFVAREAGPELVGTIGNRTAVVNNDQIVEAVSEGVYAAVMNAMRANAGDGGQATVNVYLDGRQLTSAVEKRQRERGASIVGNQVYAY